MRSFDRVRHQDLPGRAEGRRIKAVDLDITHVRIAESGDKELSVEARKDGRPLRHPRDFEDVVFRLSRGPGFDAHFAIERESVPLRTVGGYAQTQASHPVGRLERNEEAVERGEGLLDGASNPRCFAKRRHVNKSSTRL